MKPREAPLACSAPGCPGDAEYCDSVPDANIDGVTPGECGYRLVALCWLHAAERRVVNTARVRGILRDEAAGVGRVLEMHTHADVFCWQCGRLASSHPECVHAGEEWLKANVLCDGAAVVERIPESGEGGRG